MRKSSARSLKTSNMVNWKSNICRLLLKVGILHIRVEKISLEVFLQKTFLEVICRKSNFWHNSVNWKTNMFTEKFSLIFSKKVWNTKVSQYLQKKKKLEKVFYIVDLSRSLLSYIYNCKNDLNGGFPRKSTSRRFL